MALALELLADPALETLVTGRSEFGELPEVMPRIAGGELPVLCHLITYGDETKDAEATGNTRTGE